MTLLLKIFSRFCVFLLVFWIVVAIAMSCFHLEFMKTRTEDLFYEIRFFGVPLAVLGTLAGTIRKGVGAGVILSVVVTTLVTAGIAFLVMVGTLFSGICNWDNGETLYVSKENERVKIVLRGYGCGALDRSDPVEKPFKVHETYFGLMQVSNIDTSKIDHSQWEQIK